jgi:ABC-type dipeptide/oligopeptide/nickel transport system permease subunit
MDCLLSLRPDAYPRSLLAPSLHYLAGTDEYGRDVFSRLLYGSQLSLALGVPL